MEWVCCTRANLTDVPSLKTMRQSGCKELAVGIESGSELILKNINKGVTKDDIRACASACKEADILFYGMTIVGLPGETDETWRETIDFIKEIDPFYTQFCFSTPFPNTDMYPWYEKNDCLNTRIGRNIHPWPPCRWCAPKPSLAGSGPPAPGSLPGSPLPPQVPAFQNPSQRPHVDTQGRLGTRQARRGCLDGARR